LLFVSLLLIEERRTLRTESRKHAAVTDKRADLGRNLGKPINISIRHVSPSLAGRSPDAVRMVSNTTPGVRSAGRRPPARRQFYRAIAVPATFLTTPAIAMGLASEQWMIERFIPA
jgi:hypothetical protein